MAEPLLVNPLLAERVERPRVVVRQAGVDHSPPAEQAVPRILHDLVPDDVEVNRGANREHDDEEHVSLEAAAQPGGES